MIVAGIDPSLTSAGVAVLRDGKPVHTSHHGFHRKGHYNDQRRSRRIRHQERLTYTAATSCGKPDLVVIERPLTIVKSADAFDRYELAQRLYGDFDHALGGRVVYMHNTTAKVWVTGKGNASKDDTIAAVEEWWPGIEIACDDEADALGLATIGAFHLGDPMPFTPKPRHTTGLEKVHWPAMA